MSTTVSPSVTRIPLKPSAFSDEQIQEVARRDRQGIAEWAQSTAAQRGVMVRRLPNDEFVKAVSRLSDGVVDLDPVEELLVALGRAGVISSYQSGLLQVQYLR